MNVWTLDPQAFYLLDGDELVTELMRQLGVPDLFTKIGNDGRELHQFVVFDNHPTHWITLHIWKGLPRADRNGLRFDASPKSAKTIAQVASKCGNYRPFLSRWKRLPFSQFPTPEKPRTLNPMIKVRLSNARDHNDRWLSGMRTVML